MITEDYVSFEVAKLMKERGFDEECIYVYRHDGSEDIWDADKEDIACQKPTLQMAVKWLREVHKIGVFPSTYAFTVGKNGSAKHVYGTAIINLETYELMTNDLMPMPTYEEATEAAIKYCLENLI